MQPTSKLVRSVAPVDYQQTLVKQSPPNVTRRVKKVPKYTVEETGTDATVTYDTMKVATVTVGSSRWYSQKYCSNVTDPVDKEFNNTVVLLQKNLSSNQRNTLFLKRNTISLVTSSLMMIKSWQTSTQIQMRTHMRMMHQKRSKNLNTKTVERGSKLVYQVWLDTTKFDAANKDNIQTVGISDDYDEAKLDLDAPKIKAYDSVTGAEVTDKFDITVNNGVITATLKDGFTKSLGDAENTQVIDTTKFEFGRYYKFDIPTTVKADVRVV